MYKNVFITVIDVMRIYECSARTAYRRIREIRRYFNKHRHQRLTLQDLAKYEGLPPETLMSDGKKV